MLTAWGWNEDLEKFWRAQERPGALVGRIISQREDTYSIISEEGLLSAHPAGVLFHKKDELARPAVGDWVAVETTAQGGALVTLVLPRRSYFLREASGGRGVAQVVASNVDVVFLVTPVCDVNLNRLERFMVAICAGGAQPAVVLSKGDLASPEQEIAAAAEVRGLMEGLKVLSTSTPWSRRQNVCAEFEPHLVAGQTYALVGSSGAGKSSLLNALVGEQRQQTGEVREGDGKGRHVTSFRELFSLPGGALVMDTPGMREFALWADDGGLEQVFADLSARAEQCRFADCTHLSEPGCAVLGAVEEGALSRRRVDNWRTLAAEMVENQSRQQVMRARRERGDLRRKKQRDRRFSRR